MIIFEYLIPFVLILSFIVFIHEFGHYYVAKRFGVKIDEFSIGFGKEVFGWFDKSGTRWKFCLIPLGGYVKMFGDQDASSKTNTKLKLSAAEKKVAFAHKTLGQKFLIVLAGPVANYILGIVIIFFLFTTYGVSSSSNIITKVVDDMPAAQAGLQAGDKITNVDGLTVSSFNDLKRIVEISADIPLNFTIERADEVLNFVVTPKAKQGEDAFGNKISTGLIGVTSDKINYKEVGIGEALYLSGKEVVTLSLISFKVIGQLITGERSISDLGGPVKIAKYSGQVTKKSISKDQDGQRNFYLLFWFVALISINLGFANLLPIPVLDGGHLMLYAIEYIRGKELSAKAQDIAFKTGFSFLIFVFLLVTYSDIKFVLYN